MTLTGAVLCSTSVLADPETTDADGPDMDFLEYLGMWEESDEDWQLLNAEDDAAEDRHSDSVPEGKTSRDTGPETGRETNDER